MIIPTPISQVFCDHLVSSTSYSILEFLACYHPVASLDHTSVRINTLLFSHLFNVNTFFLDTVFPLIYYVYPASDSEREMEFLLEGKNGKNIKGNYTFLYT